MMYKSFSTFELDVLIKAGGLALTMGRHLPIVAKELDIDYDWLTTLRERAATCDDVLERERAHTACVYVVTIHSQDGDVDVRTGANESEIMDELAAWCQMNWNLSTAIRDSRTVQYLAGNSRQIIDLFFSNSTYSYKLTTCNVVIPTTATAEVVGDRFDDMFDAPVEHQSQSDLAAADSILLRESSYSATVQDEHNHCVTFREPTVEALNRNIRRYIDNVSGQSSGDGLELDNIVIARYFEAPGRVLSYSPATPYHPLPADCLTPPAT